MLHGNGSPLLRFSPRMPGDNRPQWEMADAADFAGFWLRHQRIGTR